MTDVEESAETVGSRHTRWAIVILLVVIAVLAGVLVATMRSGPRAGGDLRQGSSTASTEVSITSVHNDATADYEAALKTGKPIYVLFHSLT